MIKRIVKMEFIPEKVDEFMLTFVKYENKIRNQPGCIHMELLQDENNANVFFTYSCWDSHEALEKYRSSSLFKEVWSITKIHFKEKAQAWSLKNKKDKQDSCCV